MEVPDEFNAIGSCVKKEYTYLIYNSSLRDPFYVNRAWQYPVRLDEAVLQRAADRFVGEHDFAAVRSVGTEVRSTVRTVYYYNITREEDLLRFYICANGFLYNMARAMTSNAGSDRKDGSVGFGRSLSEQSREKAIKALGEFLRPEFINRVDEVVCFNKLTEENFRGIAGIMDGLSALPTRLPGPVAVLL